MSIQLCRAPTDDEIEEICTAAEEAARRLILSKIALKKVADLDLVVEAEGDKPLSLSVEVAVETELEDSALDQIIDEATDAAFAAAEARARELGLCEMATD